MDLRPSPEVYRGRHPGVAIQAGGGYSPTLDGRREPLTYIDRYDFNWQIVYPYKDPPVFPAGTVLHVTSYHDNSTDNPYNPDPTAWVGWGNRTIDDMAIGWTNFVYLNDEELAAAATGK